MTHAAKDYFDTTPHRVPRGKIVVHNQVTPQEWLGFNGFRAWRAPAPASWEYERCNCNWALHLAEHYRISERYREEGTKLGKALQDHLGEIDRILETRPNFIVHLIAFLKNKGWNVDEQTPKQKREYASLRTCTRAGVGSRV